MKNRFAVKPLQMYKIILRAAPFSLQIKYTKSNPSIALSNLGYSCNIFKINFIYFQNADSS